GVAPNQVEPIRLSPGSIHPPVSLAAAGLTGTLVIALALKHLQRRGDLAIGELPSAMALPLPLPDKLLGFLRAERLVEVPRRGSFDADVRYALAELGRARANEALRRNQYVGPAPVSLSDYVAQVGRQHVVDGRVTPARV